MAFPYIFPFYFEDTLPARTFNVWCDDIDVTDKTLLGTSFSNSLGAVGTLNIIFESTVAVDLYSIVRIDDINLGILIFWGTVREWTCKQQSSDRYVKECTVYDRTKGIYDATGITATYTGTEKAILTAAFAANCPTVNVGDGVITGNASGMTLTNGSLRDGLDALRAADTRIWYVDDYAELQWFTLGDWPEAPFDVSDTPDNITTFPFHAFEYTEDAINLSAGASRGSLKVFRSGLHAGQHLEITNSVVDGSGSFGSAHYPITGVSGRLITTLDNDIQWDYTIEFGFWDGLLAGYRSNNNITSRLVNAPVPTQSYQIVNKKYVDDSIVSSFTFASIAETTTGTEDAKAVTPDGLAGSDYGKRTIEFCLNGSAALTTSDKVYARIPSTMNGWNLVGITAMCKGASSSGNVTLTLKNGATSMLTTNITIEESEFDSSTATNQPAIDTGNDDVATGDQIEAACSAAGATVTYCVVEATFRK